MADRTLARYFLLAVPIAASLGSSPALSENNTALSYISISQSEGELGQAREQQREVHLLECRRSVCTGRLPLTIEQRTYTYDAVSTIFTEDGTSIQININLHPRMLGCGPGCQPNLAAVHATLPLKEKSHIIVAVKQFQGPDSAGAVTDAIHRIRKEPVAFLDISLVLRNVTP